MRTLDNQGRILTVGEQGPTGPLNPTGPTGPVQTGPTGAQSITTGPTGPLNSTGPTGAEITGPTGADCNTTGPTGAVITGPSGADSLITGPSGADSLTTGPTGAQSLTTGPTGADSLTTGPTGADSLTTGPTGADSLTTGPTGADSLTTGPTGADSLTTGPTGADSLTTGPTGADSLTTGPTGGFGPTGAEITGPTGADSITTGPTGGFGPTGAEITGPTGAGAGGGVNTTNVITNGNFDIWQRGTSFQFQSFGMTRSADMWSLDYELNGNWLVTGETDVPDKVSLYSLKVQTTNSEVTLSSHEYLGLRQNIEGSFFQAVRDKPMTLSFWVKSYQTGTFCVTLVSSDMDERFVAEYTINSSETWEKKTIQISAIPGGTWRTGTDIAGSILFWLMAGSNHHSTTGWDTGAKKATSNQTNLMSSTNNYWQIAQVQLEPGSSATDFKVMSPTEVLASCQRYLVAYNADSNYDERIALGYCKTTSIADCIIHLPVTMHRRPDPFVSNLDHFGLFYNNSTIAGCTQLTRSEGHTEYNTAIMSLEVTVSGTPLTAGHATVLVINYGTGKYLYLSAEM